MKPCSPASERNKDAILEVLARLLRNNIRVLEIGSGTGQHAVYFAQHLPHITWLTSDRLDNHEGIKAWIADANVANVVNPVELDVSMAAWPKIDADAVYSANTAHIMSWSEVGHMFEGVGGLLSRGGLFCLYGPFNYGGRFTSNSNRAFDQSLKSQHAHMGIRDMDDLGRLADGNGLVLSEDREMPANNRILVWKKQ